MSDPFRKGKAGRDLSQLDPGGTLKAGFDDDKQSFRFHDSEGPCYDRFETTIDSNGNITKIKYLVGTVQETTEVITNADVAGSLNNTYFILASTFDQVQFYVWYNVNGTGIDPNIAGAIGIEIPILTNDSAAVIAAATRGFLNANDEVKYYFEITNVTNTINIKNKKAGPVTLTGDNDTGFLFNITQQGQEEIDSIYCMTYNGCDLTGSYKL